MLVADDDEGVLRAISRLLSLECEVVGRVADTASLFDAAVNLRPDVVLLDFSLPGGVNALDVCRQLKKMTPDVKIVAFTADDDADLRQLAHEAGASGFVWKLEASTELLATIQAVVDDGSR